MWQEKLDKFLPAFATLAFMMFRRELKTKLPELKREKQLVDEATRKLDWRRKVAGKLKADQSRAASTNNLIQGQQVLLRNTRRHGKLASKYESELYAVTRKEGQEVTFTFTDRVQYTRHSSFVKPFSEPVQKENTRTGTV